MKSLFITILSLCTLASIGQKSDPAFSRIRFAGYELAGTQQKIFFYSEIDASGNFTIQTNFLSKERTVRLKLADSTMQLLRSVFNGSELQRNIVPKDMRKGEHYSNSSYRYIQVEYGTKKEGLSFVRYILDEQMRNLVIQLENNLDQEDQPESQKPLSPDASFTKAMRQSFSQSKHLPK
jgi:hypothetical protein